MDLMRNPEKSQNVCRYGREPGLEIAEMISNEILTVGFTENPA
jgi:hypothetical protein